jgi:hypothetical protein
MPHGRINFYMNPMKTSYLSLRSSLERINMRVTVINSHQSGGIASEHQLTDFLFEAVLMTS